MTKTFFSRLILALVTIVGDGCSTAKDNGSMMKPRRLDEIKLSADLTEEQVLALWGPPDRRRGSGVDYKVYALQDGQELSLEYSPDAGRHLLGAILFSSKTGERNRLFPPPKQ